MNSKASCSVSLACLCMFGGVSNISIIYIAPGKRMAKNQIKK
jgi:hypothetical protein